MKLRFPSSRPPCVAGAAPARPRRHRPGQGAVLPAAVLPHRPLRAQRHALGQRQAGLPEDDQCPRRRHQRRQAHLRGMRDRLRHRPRRGVLRAPQEPPGRDAVRPAVHRHHLRADREGAGRQDPADHAGLRPVDLGRTAWPSSGTSRSWAATGPAPTSWCSTSARRKAAWTSSRARRSRWSTTTARSARSRSRCCRSAPSMHGFELQLLPVTAPGVEQKATWLQVRQQRPGLRASVGLGRDELHRAEGSAGHRLPARQDVRRVVGRRRAGRQGRGRGRQGLQRAGAQHLAASSPR